MESFTGWLREASKDVGQKSGNDHPISSGRDPARC
jgi:hypothetical protein